MLSEIFVPGWQAQIDGVATPIRRTDYVLRGLALPAGAHRVSSSTRAAFRLARCGHLADRPGRVRRRRHGAGAAEVARVNVANANAMPARLPARVVALVLLIGAVIGLLTPPRIFSDGSNYVCMAVSLISDGDLRWTRDDLQHVRALRADGATPGLLLVKRADGYVFAKPVIYPLAAAPFVALAGVRGFMLLNGLLLAALVLLGADVLTHRLAWPAALGVAAAAVGASVTPVYLHWIDPFLLLSVCTAGALAAYRRGRPGLAGALLGVMSVTRFPVCGAAAGAGRDVPDGAPLARSDDPAGGHGRRV